MRPTRQTSLGEERSTGPHAAVLLVELDQVEQIREALGSPAAEEVRRRSAERIRLALRSGDFSARWRREEFVVALRTSSMEAAVEVAQRIRVSVSQPIQLADGRTVVPTCSVGCAVDPTAPMAELVAIAGSALDEAKASGRNCVRRAAPSEQALQARQDRRLVGVATSS